VVGRPPQEDTAFGALIHELTGDAIKEELPGVKEVHAVDAAGVHPLLLAIGSERYTPYAENPRPAELLTISNHILGTGQLSLAKWLFIASQQDNPELTTHNEKEFFRHILQRINLQRDLHFHTQTSIDTLDYSGDGLNTGSKLVLAAVGKPIRNLGSSIPTTINLPEGFSNITLAMPGVLCVMGPVYNSREDGQASIEKLKNSLEPDLQLEFPLITVCNDSDFLAKDFSNWLWVTFTRSNPSHDVYGVGEFILNKHWACKGPLIIDARQKPHHAPVLEMPFEFASKASKIINTIS
jgi:4-hydroxy-3-polyprenylbenzoate decarboxylase